MINGVTESWRFSELETLFDDAGEENDDRLVFSFILC